MNILEKKEKLQVLLEDTSANATSYHSFLEEMGDLKTDYHDYMKTGPIEVDTEIERVPTADYNLCTALLTMLLREDYFCNGSFDRRKRNGQVKSIVKRMIEVL